MSLADGLPEVRHAVGSIAGSDGAVAEALDGRRTSLLAVPVSPGPVSRPGDVYLPPPTTALGRRIGIDLADAARRLRLTGAAGELGLLTLPAPWRADPAEPAEPAESRDETRPGVDGVDGPGVAGPGFPWAGLPGQVLLLGVGAGDPVAMRRAGAALARGAERADGVAAVLPGRADVEGVRAFTEGYLLAAYRPPRPGASQDSAPRAARLLVVTPRDPDEHAAAPDVPPAEVLAGAQAAGAAAWTARRLAATPSNIKTPDWLARQSVEAAAAQPHVAVTVRDADWLAEHGFGGVLAVGGGSAAAPRLVVVDYDPPHAAGRRHVALVGKGVTFDTGGLSLKDREAMVPMKTDMAGAAAALAAVLGCARIALAHRVTAVLPLAENALGAASYRPGDVLRLVDGSTVEVLNTDAEGRLLLADALAWTRTALRPELVVDIATLTGAATMGLGKRHGALYATDEPLARGLLAAGEAAGERLWRMPLVEDYDRALDSAVADVANVATDPHVRGGSITAALFLRRFAGGTPWAHLDIAGPARAPKNEHEVTEGPSGFGARLLLRWLEGLGRSENS